MIIVVMGVSGCGKSTIAELLANKLGISWYDADNFHPQANIDKMKNGIPLTDADRMPWLNRLSFEMVFWENEGGAVLACSALKESYRTILRGQEKGNVRFVYLQGSKECILNRMKQRSGHYMPTSLLDSQFATLEVPQNAITVSIEESPETIVETIVSQLKKAKSPHDAL